MYSKFALSNLLFATAALAAPPSQQGARLDRRQENHLPVNSVGSSARAVPNYVGNPYWAGAVVSGNNGTFSTVTGTFTVPALSGGRGNSTRGYSVQVGIDAYTCQTGLQVGVNAMIVDGTVSYSAWYDSMLVTDRALDFEPITIHASDVLTISIGSSTNGKTPTTIKNHTTGKIVSTDIAYNPTCGSDVVWLVGVHKGNPSLILANFDTVTFTNATSTANHGTDYNPIDATSILDIVLDEKTLVAYTNPGTDSLLVQYISDNPT